MTITASSQQSQPRRPGPRIAPRPRPLSLWHFTNPRNWNVGSARQALEQSSQSLLDGVVLKSFALTRTQRSDAYLRNIHRDALQAIEVYDRIGWLDDPVLAHATPKAPRANEVTIQRERVGRIDFEHLSFPSAYEPHPEDPSSARWLKLVENRTAHAWVMRHEEPRPWVVNVHGASMGSPRMDFRLFKSVGLHKMGLNVIHPILPLHGPRQSHDPAHYPSESVMHNLHGALQGVSDVRRTIAWVRKTQPGQPIAVHGISLGGFTSAMVASLESELACVILGVAPVDLVLLLEAHHGTGVGYDLRVQNFEVGARLSSMVTPLKLKPAIPLERRFMYAGVVDRLVDYADHIAPMVAHWDYPEILVFDGGHVGLGINGKIPPFIKQALIKTGVLSE